VHGRENSAKSRVKQAFLTGLIAAHVGGATCRKIDRKILENISKTDIMAMEADICQLPALSI
jgi:hypothetical protein